MAKNVSAFYSHEIDGYICSKISTKVLLKCSKGTISTSGGHRRVFTRKEEECGTMKMAARGILGEFSLLKCDY